MSIDMRDIRYFLAVGKCGRLSRAAEECGVTQSALTKAIQRVERVFGPQLFDRTPGGMLLSADGLRVLEQIQRLDASYADTLLLASELRAQKAGLLRVGITDTSANNPIVPSLAELLTHRPGLRIRIDVGRSDVLAGQVRDGDLDVAVVPVYKGGQSFETIQTKIHDEDTMVLIVGVSHPLAKKSHVELSDLVPYGWVLGGTSSAAYLAVAEVFARHELPAPRIVIEVTHSSAMQLAVLSSTNLVGLFPSSAMRLAAHDRFAFPPAPQLRISRAVVLLTRSGSSWSPLVEDLRGALIRRRRRMTDSFSKA